MSSAPYISGLAFHKIAKWSFCPRYPVLLEPNNFQKDDIVFLNLEYFQQFIQILQKNPPKNKFILITHNSDKLFDDNYFNIIKDVVTKVYAINCICSDSRAIPIPIGYRDHPYDTITKLKSTPIIYDKDILLYMNFELNTNIEKRTQCKNVFDEYPWVEKEGFLKKDALPLEEFYKKMSRSKYILSPEGTGIDCHRIYESIFLNAIPIMKKTQMDSFYSKLPILIISDWREITETFLNNNYDRLYSNLLTWKINNPNWLRADYWLHQQY